jgi:CRISPR-associated protein (TIGR03986 family)
MADAFLNPYTFIPAFPRKNLPEQLRDAAPPVRNHLRPEAWTGRIPVTLTVETPLLLLDTSRYRTLEDGSDHQLYPVRLRDGRPYLPATSVKGMLRAAYEAITNSRFGVFEPHDERFGFRRDAGFALDLVPVYVGKGQRVHRLRMAALRLYDREGEALYPPERMPRHGERIKALIGSGRTIDRVVDFTRDLTAELPAGRGERQVTGIAYVTGPNIEGKTTERLFFSEEAPEELALARPWAELVEDWKRLIENYREVHDPKDLYDRSRPDGRKAGPGERVGKGPGQLAWSPHLYDDAWRTLKPGSVCYARLAGGRVERLYPVMVPRDLYSATPRDLLPEDLRPAPTCHDLSPADRLFGWVAPPTKKRILPAAYRGRLRIGPVTCDDEAGTAVRRFEDGLPLAILSTPKPQQGRFYLAESAARPDKPVRPGTAKADLYRPGRGLRGRKAYWHHAGLDARQHWNPEVPGGMDPSQTTVGGRYREYLRPRVPVDDRGTLTGDKRRYATKAAKQRDNQNRSIEGWVTPGTTFRFTIEVRDADDYELGALVWLLTLPDGCFHRLGFGRPLGFGSVRLDVDSAGVELHSGADYHAYYRTLAGDLPDTDGPAILQNARKRFEELLESSSELKAVRDAMLAVAQGRHDLPVHYPRTRPDDLLPGLPVPPDPRGENFKWFTENERLTKGSIAPGRGRSLPGVLGNDMPLEAYPEKAERPAGRPQDRRRSNRRH